MLNPFLLIALSDVSGHSRKMVTPWGSLHENKLR